MKGIRISFVGIVSVLIAGGLILILVLRSGPSVGSRMIDLLGKYPGSSIIYRNGSTSSCSGVRSEDVVIVTVTDDNLETVQAHFEKQMLTICSATQEFVDTSDYCDFGRKIAGDATPVPGSKCIFSACYLTLAPAEYLTVTLISSGTYQSSKTTIVEGKSSNYRDIFSADRPCRGE